jgi:hypothetical protein
MVQASSAFNRARYSRPPLFDTPHGVGLAIGLLGALPPVVRVVPAAATARLLNKARGLRATALELQAAWRARPSRATDLVRVLADHRVDVAWAAVYDRIAAYATLGADRYELAARAEQLLVDLFDDLDLGFLKLDFELELAESARRLAHIDTANLASDIEAIAGADFLVEVRAAHQAYEKALHPDVTTVRKEPPELQGPRRALAAAMGDYLHQLLGVADEAEFPGSVAAVKTALFPIDQYRERLSKSAQRKAASTGGAADATGMMPPPDVTPATPIPEVPSH